MSKNENLEENNCNCLTNKRLTFLLYKELKIRKKITQRKQAKYMNSSKKKLEQMSQIMKRCSTAY